MKYCNIVEGEFLSRPNRFIAHVIIEGKEEIVHVKNTGRCREILIPGTRVYLEKAANPHRKTGYSLISAYKGNELINIDSQVPNGVVFEAIKQGLIPEIGVPTLLKREVTFGNSRYDLYFEDGERKGFIEVKGVTLEKDRMAMFPDAPTTRGKKHVLEMIQALATGFEGYIFFLMQMKGVDGFTPNREMDKDFAEAIDLAVVSGVKLLAYECCVLKDGIFIGNIVEIK